MNMGVMLKGTGITVQGLTGGALREDVVILVSTLLFVSYGLAGGIVAAVVTDLVQGILILILSFSAHSVCDSSSGWDGRFPRRFAGADV